MDPAIEPSTAEDLRLSSYEENGNLPNSCGLCKMEKRPVEERNASSPSKFQRDDEWDMWIQCESCLIWYHASCVDVEEYEISLIKKFHCKECVPKVGPSIMKEYLCNHRYLFSEPDEVMKPVQVGTYDFVQRFKISSENIPEASPSVLKVCQNGYTFFDHFNFNEEWRTPYKVLSTEGLEMEMPKKEDFYIDDVVDVLGEDVVIETIDVYAQHTYLMSLGRFRSLWKSSERKRLYNILSLEFSETPLAELVKSPSIVRRLSWVCKFWPNNNGGPVNDESENWAIFNDIPPSYDMQMEHTNSKPYVENFCLLGMKDSYTDFHIDFGGSSVWYHVFRGEKVFYVAAPSEENFQRFIEYQNLPNRSEVFFGDMLPKGELQKLVVRQGETLLIPSGWIHSVWTPVDSLVFGGNFLHSLNIATQLKVYEMEEASNIEERFKFPYFELTNWYAAQASILEILKDANEEPSLIPEYLKRGVETLVPILKMWIESNKKSTEETQKPIFKSFYRTLRHLEKEVRKQRQIENRHSSCSPIRLSEEDEDDCHSPVKITIKLSGYKKLKKQQVKRRSFDTKVPPPVDVDKSAAKPSCSTKFKDDLDDLNEDDESKVDMTTIFGGRSAHGRRVKPTSKLVESIEENGGSIELPKERTPPASESKNFYAQFSESERIMIEKAEKAAVEEERCSKYLDEYNAKTSASSRKGNNVGAGSTTSSGLTKQTSNEGRKAVKRPDTVKSRLAKKLKMKF